MQITRKTSEYRWSLQSSSASSTAVVAPPQHPLVAQAPHCSTRTLVGISSELKPMTTTKSISVQAISGRSRGGCICSSLDDAGKAARQSRHQPHRNPSGAIAQQHETVSRQPSTDTARGTGGARGRGGVDGGSGNPGAKESATHPRHTPSRPPPLPPLPPPDHSGGGYTLVSSPAELNVMLDQLVAAGYGKGSADGGGAGSGSRGRSGGLKPLGVDCEGVELGRPEGRLCLLQLSARCGGGGSGGGRSVRSGVSIWLVDVEQLGWRAFHYRSLLDGATSLRSLLEDPAVTKYLYDVRNDAAALASQYGVRLRGVVDLQLADVAVRQAEDGVRGNCWVEGLVSALSRRLTREGRVSAPARLSEDMAAAMSVSRWYHSRNNTEVWAQRPLTAELCEYAATDVRYLHLLADSLTPRLNKDLAARVAQESHRRTVVRVPNNQSRAEAPIMVPIKRRSDAPGAAASSGSPKSSGMLLSTGFEAGATLPAGERSRRDVMDYIGLMEGLTAALLMRYERYGVTTSAASGQLAKGVEAAGTEALPARALVSLPTGPSAVRVEERPNPGTRNSDTPGSQLDSPGSQLDDKNGAHPTPVLTAGAVTCTTTRTVALPGEAGAGEAGAGEAGDVAGPLGAVEASAYTDASPTVKAVYDAQGHGRTNHMISKDVASQAPPASTLPPNLDASSPSPPPPPSASPSALASGSAAVPSDELALEHLRAEVRVPNNQSPADASITVPATGVDVATWAERLAAAEAAFAALAQGPRGMAAAASTATATEAAAASTASPAPPGGSLQKPTSTSTLTFMSTCPPRLPSPILTSTSKSLHRPALPPSPPLLVPSIETMMWAESVLVSARITSGAAGEGRPPSPWVPGGRGPGTEGTAVPTGTGEKVSELEPAPTLWFEEEVQARAAVGWLRRSQRVLEARLGGAGATVRGDLGLKWLLPPQ